MQVDKQLFPINIIELTDKKVLIQTDVTDKDKGRNIIIGIPLTSNISQGVVTRKALNKIRTNKTGGTEGHVR
jgi:hypothetical protein